MTTTPAPAPGVDQQLAERCQTSGDYLAGVIAAGALDKAGRPEKLPELLFPDTDPDVVRAIWDRALTVGYWCGKAVSRPHGTPEGFDRLRQALTDAGYNGMASLAARSQRSAPTATPDRPKSVHPADPEQRGVRTVCPECTPYRQCRTCLDPA